MSVNLDKTKSEELREMKAALDSRVIELEGQILRYVYLYTYVYIYMHTNV
jgi:hypothetical protein